MRIKLVAGHSRRTQVVTVEEEDLVAVLEDAGRELLEGAAVVAVQLLGGFPPRQVQGRTVVEAGLKEGDVVRVESAGHMVRRVIPADNSCLFMAVAYTMFNTRDSSRGLELRELVAETLEGDAERWTDEILGKPRAEYIQHLRKTTTWGSFIELVILAEHFETEFVCIDIKSLQQMQACNESNAFSTFSVLLFDGIHWDAFALSNCEDDESRDTTVFQLDQKQYILPACMQIATEAHAARQFTDVNKFSLQCLVCGVGLTGQDQAVQHSKETGHTNFGEM